MTPRTPSNRRVSLVSARLLSLTQPCPAPGRLSCRLVIALHRSSSTNNLTGLSAAASLARLLDEDLPPEPAVNLSNKLNPNNIHYDRELAARCVGCRVHER